MRSDALPGELLRQLRIQPPGRPAETASRAADPHHRPAAAPALASPASTPPASLLPAMASSAGRCRMAAISPRVVQIISYAPAYPSWGGPVNTCSISILTLHACGPTPGGPVPSGPLSPWPDIAQSCSSKSVRHIVAIRHTKACDQRHRYYNTGRPGTAAFQIRACRQIILSRIARAPSRQTARYDAAALAYRVATPRQTFNRPKQFSTG